MNVMEVNAALWNLVERKEIKASTAVVIQYAQTLKVNAPFVLMSVTTGKSGENVTGATEHGNVTISNQKEETCEFTLGFHKARVGHFRIWRPQGNEICFHHFWKSSEETAGEEVEVDEYKIEHTRRTLELKHFGVFKSKEFRLWVFVFILHAIETIWGKERKWPVSFSFGLDFGD